MTGHALSYSYVVPSGWKALCMCGHVSHGITQALMLDHHERHVNEVFRPVLGQDGKEPGPGGATDSDAVDTPQQPAAAGRASVDTPPGHGHTEPNMTIDD